MAATLVDTNHNDPEQSTSLLLSFTDAVFDRLSPFASQMRIVATAYVTDPAMLVRSHRSILNR
jgi:hypothetical protein